MARHAAKGLLYFGRADGSGGPQAIHKGVVHARGVRLLRRERQAGECDAALAGQFGAHANELRAVRQHDSQTAFHVNARLSDAIRVPWREEGAINGSQADLPGHRADGEGFQNDPGPSRHEAALTNALHARSLRLCLTFERKQQSRRKRRNGLLPPAAFRIRGVCDNEGEAFALIAGLPAVSAVGCADELPPAER